MSEEKSLFEAAINEAAKYANDTFGKFGVEMMRAFSLIHKPKKLRLPRKLKKWIKLINIRHEGVFLEWSIERIAWSVLNNPFYKKHYRNKKQYRTTKYKKL